MWSYKFFLLKILAKQFILKNTVTIENLHKMYIDSGFFFPIKNISPLTTQNTLSTICV